MKVCAEERRSAYQHSAVAAVLSLISAMSAPATGPFRALLYLAFAQRHHPSTSVLKQYPRCACAARVTCAYVCVCVRACVRVSVCLSVCLSICLCVCLSTGANLRIGASRRLCSSQVDSASLCAMNCYCRLWITSEENMREE